MSCPIYFIPNSLAMTFLQILNVCNYNTLANAICYASSLWPQPQDKHMEGGWTRRAAESAVAGGRNRREDAYVCAITPPTDLAYIRRSRAIF